MFKTTQRVINFKLQYVLGSPIYYYDEPYQEFPSRGRLRDFQETDGNNMIMDVRNSLFNEAANRGGLGNQLILKLYCNFVKSHNSINPVPIHPYERSLS